MKFLSSLKITIIFIVIHINFYGQSSYQAPTLSAGLDNVTFKQGTLDVELLAKIISEKQRELVREGIKRTIYKSIGNSKKLDDLTQFYIERVVDVIFNEKNHKVITKRVLEETTNYLFILGITKYILESKNEAINFLFLEEDSFKNLDKNQENFTNSESIQIKEINKKLNIKQELENIESYSLKNAIITSILTISKEIPIVKELGLLNDFNYLEHRKIYNSSLSNDENNLIKLISLEKYFDFEKIDSISIENFGGTLIDLLMESPKDETDISYLNGTLNVKKCISILRIYWNIKELISNSNILKDITSKSGIKFNSVINNFNSVIDKYKKSNIYSKDSKDLIFNIKKRDINKSFTTLNGLIRVKESKIDKRTYIQTIRSLKSIQKALINSKRDIRYNKIISILNKNTYVDNISGNYSFNENTEIFKLLNELQDIPVVKNLIQNRIPNLPNMEFNSSVFNAFLKNIEALKIDMTELTKVVTDLQVKKNIFYVNHILEAHETTKKNINNLSNLKNQQEFIGSLNNQTSKLQSDKFFTTVIPKFQSSYTESRKLYKFNQGLKALYQSYLNNDNSLNEFVKNKDFELLNKNALEQFLKDGSNIQEVITYYKTSISKIQLEDYTASNIQYPKSSVFDSISLELKRFFNNVNLSDIHNISSEALFTTIRKKLEVLSLDTKENQSLSTEESESLKKLYSIFIDRFLEDNVDNLNIIRLLDQDLLSELFVLSNKLENGNKLKEIIRSIEFSITSLMIKKMEKNKDFLSSKNIDHILNFLKFIGNIKEFNKAETFTFLLKTMDDYQYLLNFEDENLRIIPDLINSLRTYSIIDYDNNLIEIDVASVLIHLLEKYQEKSNVIFYATVGVNQFFIPNFDKNNPSSTNYNFGSFNAASEKIGAKWKLIDWNKKYYRESELIHKIRRKAYVSDYYIMGYVSGILYKIADTSGNNFDSAQIGLATGFTFFNSLDFNVSVSVPFDSEPFNNYILGFSFDIPLSEYLKRL